MDNNIVPVSRSTLPNSTGVILTEDNPKRLLLTTSALFKTIVNKGVQSDGHQCGDQELTKNLTGRWVQTTENMAYMPKHPVISKAAHDTENHLAERDSGASVKAELLSALKTEVQAGVEAVKREVLRVTIEKTLTNIFLDGMRRRRECRTFSTISSNTR